MITTGVCLVTERRCQVVRKRWAKWIDMKKLAWISTGDLIWNWPVNLLGFIHQEVPDEHFRVFLKCLYVSVPLRRVHAQCIRAGEVCVAVPNGVEYVLCISSCLPPSEGIKGRAAATPPPLSLLTHSCELELPMLCHSINFSLFETFLPVNI